MKVWDECLFFLMSLPFLLHPNINAEKKKGKKVVKICAEWALISLRFTELY